jgi:hypothetical protein
MTQRYFLFALLAVLFLSESAFAQLASQPTVQASNVKVISANTTSVSLRWTNGNGQRRLVTMRLTNSAAAPTDGTTYTASTTFGSGSQIGTGTFVVYNGTDTTVTVTGLTANSAYTVGVWEYNGLTSGTQNYNPITGTNLVSFFTTTIAPTTSPTNLTISTPTPTTVTLNFTAGNGTGRVIVARAGSAVNVAPPSGTILSVGQQLGNGNFIAGITGSNTTLISSLSPNTLYHFTVYEFNGGNSSVIESGSSNRAIRTTSPATASRSTLATEPTVQASNLTVTSRGSSTVNLSWTNGNGNQRIVVARLSSSPAATINNFDGQTLTPSTSFGNGTDLGDSNFVVYRGTGSSTFVLGLSSSTTYTFRVYELNVGGSGSENYLGTVSTPNSINATTLAAAPTTQASSVTVSNPSTNALTIRWQNGNGARRLVVASQQFFTGAPTNGIAAPVANPVFGQGDTMRAGIFAVASTATVDSVRVTGLQPNTVYYFRVYEYNSSSATTSYNTSTTANGTSRTTLTSEPTVQLTNLSTLNRTDTSITLRWTNGNGAQRAIVATATSPIFQPVDGTVYNAGGNRYGSGTLLGGTSYCVYLGSDTSITVTGLSPSTIYTFTGFEFNVGNSGSQNYLTTPSSVPLETITLASMPTVQASNLIITQSSQNQIRVKWTKGNGSSRILIGKIGAPVDYVPQNGGNPILTSSSFQTAAPLGNGNFGLYSNSGDSTTFTITQAGTYHFRVFELNGTTTQQGGTQNFLTTTATNNPNSGSASLLFPEPTSQVGALIFSNITNTSIRVSFSSQGNGIGKMLFVKAGSPVDELPQDGVTYSANSDFNQAQNINGNRVVFDGVATSVTVTGLSPNTTYHFRAFAYNGSGTNINYLTTAVTGNPNSVSTTNAFTGSGNIPGGTYSALTTTGAATLTGDVTVTGNITLTGILNTGSFTLTLAPGATLTETANNYIVGTVNAERAVTGGAIEATETFGGMGVSLTSTNNLGNVTVTRLSGASGVVSVGNANGIARRWNISAQTQPTAPATVALSWVSNDDNNITLSLGRVYRLLQQQIPQWQQIASGNYSSRTATFTTSAFGEFTISDANNQLPVELVSFIGGQHREGVMLQWATASELNNSGFEVERKSNSAAWNTLGFVRGNGTTTEAQSYSFLDKSASGKVQYRLKQIDFDGQFEYSTVIEVDAGLPKEFALAQNYPNPFNPTTVISYQLPVASNVSLKIYDALGKEVATLVSARQEAGGHSIAFNANTLSSGIYFYRLQTENFVQTKKMMFVK